MQHQFFQPHPLLQPYIQTYVFANSHDWYEGETRQLQFSPIGATMLAFLLDEPNYLINEVNGKQKIRFNFQGQVDQHQTLTTMKMSLVYAVFKPFGAYRLFKIPQYLFKNDCLDMEDLIGPDIQTIKRQLIDYKQDIIKVIEIMERWLLKQLDKHRQLDSSAIQHVCQTIQLQQGTGSISSLYKSCYMSKSKLEALFRNQVGLSAKTFSRIVRFNAINQLLQQSSRTAWQDIVGQFGYTHQAHFINDFKHFCGYTPQQKTTQSPFLSENLSKI